MSRRPSWSWTYASASDSILWSVDIPCGRSWYRTSRSRPWSWRVGPSCSHCWWSARHSGDLDAETRSDTEGREGKEEGREDTHYAEVFFWPPPTFFASVEPRYQHWRRMVIRGQPCLCPSQGINSGYLPADAIHQTILLRGLFYLSWWDERVKPGCCTHSSWLDIVSHYHYHCPLHHNERHREGREYRNRSPTSSSDGTSPLLLQG
jgi:hypothetical protein